MIGLKKGLVDDSACYLLFFQFSPHLSLHMALSCAIDFLKNFICVHVHHQLTTGTTSYSFHKKKGASRLTSVITNHSLLTTTGQTKQHLVSLASNTK
jgi:hypothetical protein